MYTWDSIFLEALGVPPDKNPGKAKAKIQLFQKKNRKLQFGDKGSAKTKTTNKIETKKALNISHGPSG